AHARLVRALDDAALTMSPDDALACWGIASLIAAVVGLGLSPAMSAVATIGVGVGLPVLLLCGRSRRARLVATPVPAALEHLASELRAGGTVATALATISGGDGPFAVDMLRTETRIGLGASLDDALHAWARERPVFGVDAAAGALALSTGVGGRAADALDG